MEETVAKGKRVYESVAGNLLSALYLALVGIVLVRFELLTTASLERQFAWPVVATLVAAFAGLVGIRHSMRAIHHIRTRATLPKASGLSVAVLLPSVIGDDAQCTQRETMREALVERFGDGVDIVLWPEIISVPKGQRADPEAALQKMAADCLAVARCDLYVVGSIRSPTSLTVRIGTAAGLVNRAIFEVDDATCRLPDEFGAEVCRVVVSYLVDESQMVATDRASPPIFELNRMAQRFEALLRRVAAPELVLGYTRVLAELGERSGSSDVIMRAADLALEVLARDNENLADEVKANIFNSVASMLLSLAPSSMDVHLIHRAREYMLQAQKLFPPSFSRLNYGIMLAQLGSATSDLTVLEEAVAHFAEIISEQDDQEAETLGKAYHNLGLAYCAIYALTCEREVLDAAIMMFEESLEYRTELDASGYWAKSKVALGNALAQRGATAHCISDYEAALKSLALARDHYQRVGWREEAATVTYNLAVTRCQLSSLTGDAELLVQATGELEELARRWKGAGDKRWLNVQNVLGSTHARLAVTQGEAELADTAVAYFSAARDATIKQDSVEWIGITINMGHALTASGVLHQDVTRLREAVEELAKARELLKATPSAELERLLLDDLAQAHEKVAVLSEDASAFEAARACYQESAGCARNADDAQRWVRQSIHVAQVDSTLFLETGDLSYLERSESVLQEVLGSAEAQSRGREDVDILLAEEMLADLQRLTEEALEPSGIWAASEHRSER